jgi:hypothetical protein
MKKLLPLFFVLVLLVGAFLFFRSNRPSGSPATVWEQATEVEVEASQLSRDFAQDEAAANEKYLNKITKVTGEVGSVQSGQYGTVVHLKTEAPAPGVRCRLDRKPGESDKNYEIGQTITLKCLCSGFVNEVEMAQCE